MHCQLDSKNVTSKRQVRFSAGSSKLTHSWASSGTRRQRLVGFSSFPAWISFFGAAFLLTRLSLLGSLQGTELDQQFSGREQPAPELSEREGLVGGVETVAREGYAKGDDGHP